MSDISLRTIISVVLIVGFIFLLIVACVVGIKPAVCVPIIAVLFATLWFSIWHGVVKWTSACQLWTLFSLIWSLAIGLGIGLLLGLSGDGLAFFGTFLSVGIAIISSSLVWNYYPKKKGFRSKSYVACLKCGYNMAGLCEARCPECGTKFKLDELFFENRNRYK